MTANIELGAWGTTLNQYRIAQQPCIVIVYTAESALINYLSIRDVITLRNSSSLLILILSVPCE